MAKIFISAGELSGDIHGAHLISEIKNQYPHTQFIGMGGFHMQEQGCELIYDCRKFSLLGVVEIIKQLVLIRQLLKILKKNIREQKPDLVVLIDFSGMNLKLAKYSHALGIKTLYYVAPQVWAWRQGRIKKIKRYVDQMAVIYPFEVDFYRQHQIKADYVGNSIVEKIKPDYSREEAIKHLQLNPNAPIVALAAGSRKGEIHRIFLTILESARLLKQKIPNVQFVLPLAISLTEKDLQEKLDLFPDLNILIIKNGLANTLIACDAAIVVSGTVTLEIALLKIPQVIIYKVTKLNYQIGKRLIKTDFMGLCNVIAQEKITPEFVQDDANPETIVDALMPLIANDDIRNLTIEKMSQLKNKFIDKNQQTSLIKVIQRLIHLEK